MVMPVHWELQVVLIMDEEVMLENGLIGCGLVLEARVVQLLKRPILLIMVASVVADGMEAVVPSLVVQVVEVVAITVKIQTF